MKIFRLGFWFMGALLLAACVTVNIYFPSAQAQQAAEKIVEDILGEKPGSGNSQPGASGNNDQSSRGASFSLPIATRVIDLLVAPAQAGQPDFAVDTPEIRSLQASLKARHASLSGYYQSGAIGYTRNALVGIRDIKLVPLKLRSKLKKLIAAENRDRDRLYQAIANANGHPEWEKDVRAVFARTWSEKAQSGWWYQDSGGQWVRK